MPVTRDTLAYNFPVPEREEYGEYPDYEMAVDALTWAACMILYDDLRPGRVTGRLSSGGTWTTDWVVHDRHFAELHPPSKDDRDQPWSYSPLLLVHRERGDRGFPYSSQFALHKVNQGHTLAWNYPGKSVVLRGLVETPLLLTRPAITDLANFMVSPFLINYDPESDILEPDMPLPYPGQTSKFPIVGRAVFVPIAGEQVALSAASELAARLKSGERVSLSSQFTPAA